MYLAGLPRAGTDRLYDLVKDVWPAVEKAESVFQTTLQNGNPVIHPAVTLLNAALLERTGGDFLFYEEGVTEGVGRMIEAVDNERLAIAAALGVSILSEPAIGVHQGYMLEENYSTGYSKAPGFLGIEPSPSSTTAISPRTSATGCASSPISPRAWACPRHRSTP